MIEMKDIRVTFGSTTALNDITMHVPAGEIYGFIGPNGAGKTTSIRVMATLLRPDSGTVVINGHDLRLGADSVRNLIGYMPDFFGVYEGFTVYEYLDLFSAFYGKSKSERRQIINDILELTDLHVKAGDPVEGLSRGVKQRLGLGRALVNDPQLLLLDEPASGLDPRARVEFKEIVRELRKMGKTILISSHILSELQDICTSVGIIEAGRMLFSGSVEELRRKLQTGLEVEVRLKQPGRLPDDFLSRDERVVKVERNGAVLKIKLGRDIPDSFFIARKLFQEDITFTSFQETTIGLEEAFMKVTQGQIA